MDEIKHIYVGNKEYSITDTQAQAQIGEISDRMDSVVYKEPATPTSTDFIINVSQAGVDSDTGYTYGINLTDSSKKIRYSNAEGASSIYNAEYAHSEGKNTVVDGNRAHAEGSRARATGVASHAEGFATLATGTYAHAEGEGSFTLTSSGEIQYGTKAQGQGSHAEGFCTGAYSNYSHAEGANTEARGVYSHVEGSHTTTGGNSAHAEGSNTLAANSNSHAEGYSTGAYGFASHAEGESTYAYGYGAHAEGVDNYAYSDHAHAEGEATVVGLDTGNTAPNGHAEGKETVVFGANGHAEGESTIARHKNSHAAGFHTETGRTEQTVLGKYNTITSDSLFVVGCGTSSSTANCFETGKNNTESYIRIGSTPLLESDLPYKVKFNVDVDTPEQDIYYQRVSQKIGQRTWYVNIPKISPAQFDTYFNYLNQKHEVIIELDAKSYWGSGFYCKAILYHSDHVEAPADPSWVPYDFITGQIFYVDRMSSSEALTATITYTKTSKPGEYYVKPGNTWHITLDSTKWRAWLAIEHPEAITNFEEYGQEAVCTTNFNQEYYLFDVAATGAVNAWLGSGNLLTEKGISGGEYGVDGLTATIACHPGGYTITPSVQIHVIPEMLS